MFNGIKKSTDLAEAVFHKLKKKKVSNCKILSRRLLTYHPKQSMPLIIARIKQKNAYFKQVQKSMPCIVCNPRNINYLVTGSENFIIAQSTCREVITNTLSVLLYLHLHLRKLMRLAARFILHCDSNGNFSDIRFPNSLNPDLREEDIKTITGCRNARNLKTWFEKCGKICLKFAFFRYDNFFNPSPRMFDRYNKELENQLAAFPGKAKLRRSKRKPEDDDNDDDEEEEMNQIQGAAQPAPAPGAPNQSATPAASKKKQAIKKRKLVQTPNKKKPGQRRRKLRVLQEDEAGTDSMENKQERNFKIDERLPYFNQPAPDSQVDLKPYGVKIKKDGIKFDDKEAVRMKPVRVDPENTNAAKNDKLKSSSVTLLKSCLIAIVAFFLL